MLLNLLFARLALYFLLLQRTLQFSDVVLRKLRFRLLLLLQILKARSAAIHCRGQKNSLRRATRIQQILLNFLIGCSSQQPIKKFVHLLWGQFLPRSPFKPRFTHNPLICSDEGLALETSAIVSLTASITLTNTQLIRQFVITRHVTLRLAVGSVTSRWLRKVSLRPFGEEQRPDR